MVGRVVTASVYRQPNSKRIGHSTSRYHRCPNHSQPGHSAWSRHELEGMAGRMLVVFAAVSEDGAVALRASASTSPCGSATNAPAGPTPPPARRFCSTAAAAAYRPAAPTTSYWPSPPKPASTLASAATCYATPSAPGSSATATIWSWSPSSRDMPGPRPPAATACPPPPTPKPPSTASPQTADQRFSPAIAGPWRIPVGPGQDKRRHQTSRPDHVRHRQRRSRPQLTSGGAA